MKSVFSMLIGVAALALASPAVATSWTVSNFGAATQGGNFTYDLNFSGQMVGFQMAGSSGSVGAIRQGATTTTIGMLGGGSSTARSINATGQVAGASYVAGGGGAHLIRWTENGGISDLGTLGGPFNISNGISDAGQITGFGLTSAGQSHAFLWTEGVGMIDLGTLGGTSSYGYGLNNIGQVAGTSTTAGNVGHAFRWTAGGGMTDLGTLGGQSSQGNAINNAGQVVGWSNTVGTTTSQQAFRWTEGGGMSALGTLGGQSSWGYGINNGGLVVGTSWLANNSTKHAFLWDGSSMLDLNSLINDTSWILEEARHIDDAGRIIGYGFLNGIYSGFMLTPDVENAPVPEPGTLLLLGGGIVGLVAYRRKRRQEKVVGY